MLRPLLGRQRHAGGPGGRRTDGPSPFLAANIGGGQISAATLVRIPAVTCVRTEDGQDHAATDYFHRMGGYLNRYPDGRL